MLKRSFFIILTLFAFSCSHLELDLLDDLTLKMKENRRNLELSKEVLKNFLATHQEKMEESVKGYLALNQEDRNERYLSFNRRFYDKGGLFDLADRFLLDSEFNALFNEFKEKMKPFFAEENL